MNENPRPPGLTERVRAERVLIVAPHYDDEVLGCGGLAAQLSASGAVVRVLFLTDGGGGAEAIQDRGAYRERRRQEAEQAVRVLGAEGPHGCASLGIPDGALDRHLREAEQGLREALLSQRPDLLLVPHPLEVTRDHQAAFAVLHRLLTPVRDGDRDGIADGLFGALRDLRILLYEVNHPGHPDLLVDVSAEQGVLEAAMAAYTSQEERHPYLNAALGLRRFRTLSLGPEVALAEGYRRLEVDDFTTRSLAQLIRHLGGFPEVAEVREGPSVSVIVRTRNRPDLLAEALASLAEGRYRNAEVVLVNDGGDPPAIPSDYPLRVMRVDLEQNRGRAGAAEAGIAAATGEFVAFLDDDDLAAPEHLAILAGMVQAPGVRVAYTDAAVAIYELDDSPDGMPGGWVCRDRRLPYSRDFDPDVLLVDNYIPFNTLLIERRLFAEVGPFDSSLPFFEDWDYLIRLSARTPFHHARKVTCEYRHFRGGGHHVFGERPRERADFLAVKARVLSKHAMRLGPDVLARAVDTLRNELVNEREDRAAARRELLRLRSDLDGLARSHDALSRERFALEERYFALNGELHAQRQDNVRLRSDLQRLYDQERSLRDSLHEHIFQLRRTYAEIERLNGMIRQMETTRAWRLHQWVQERKRSLR